MKHFYLFGRFGLSVLFSIAFFALNAQTTYNINTAANPAVGGTCTGNSGIDNTYDCAFDNAGPIDIGSFNDGSAAGAQLQSVDLVIYGACSGDVEFLNGVSIATGTATGLSCSCQSISGDPLVPQNYTAVITPAAQAAYVAGGSNTLSVAGTNSAAGAQCFYGADVVVTTGGGSNQPPTSTCDGPVELSSTICGNDTNPNTPSGGWGGLPDSGVQTLLFGFPGGAFIEVDFNCLEDDTDAVGDLEIRLASSAFVAGPDPCSTYLQNVYDVRDSDGNESLQLLTILVEFTGCSSDTEAPEVTCAEFTGSGTSCPNLHDPNTPNGSWTAVPASGTFTSVVGGGVASGVVDLTTCVTDDMSALDEMEYMLMASYSENEVPGCSKDIINEYQIRDACGNVSPTTFIFRGTIIYDGDAPVITCPANVTVECGDPTDPTNTGEATATSGCGTPTITFSDASVPGCGATEVITRTWTATDGCGQVSTCMQTITTEDMMPPTITCAPAQTIECDDPVAFGMPTASDNCDQAPVITFTDASVPGCGNTEIITRTWTATDACGNSASCDEVITIEDTTPPDVTCTEFTMTFMACPDPLGPNTPNGSWIPVPASGTFLTAVGGSFITEVDLSGCVTDICSNLGDMEWTLVSSYEENRIPGCSVDLINELGIRDACENEAATTIIIRNTIQFDGPAPVITCPADSLIDCGVFPAVLTDNITATSGCGTPSISVSENPVIVGEPDVPGTTYTYTVTATDGCGQMSTCERVFIVQDTTPPAAVCMDIMVQLDDAGMVALEGTPDASQIDGGSTDNCSDGSLTFSEDITEFTCDDVGPNTIVLTVSDPSGNMSTCEAIVTVLDTIKPVITLCEDVEVFTNDGCQYVGSVPEDMSTLVAYTDNCAPPADVTGTIVAEDGTMIVPAINALALNNNMVFLSERTYPFGDNTLDITFTDQSGNTANCVLTITVSDTTRPELVCQDIILFLDDNGEATIADPVDLIASLSDNCTDSVDIELVLDARTYTCDDVSEAGTTTFSVGPVSGSLNEWLSGNAIEPTVTCDCPPGYVAVGYEGRQGLIIDQMNLLCAELMPNGTLGTDLVSTCTSGTSAGGDPSGPFNIGPLVGGEARIGGFLDNFRAYSQPIEYIINGGDNSIGATAGAEINDGMGGMNTGAEYVPAGHVIVGLVGWSSAGTGDSDDWGTGIQLRYAPITSMTTGGSGDNTASLVVTDASGNEADCTVNITVIDNIDPVVTTNDLTVVLSDDDGTFTVNPADVASATDNCEVVSLEFSRSLTFTCEDIGENEVTATATDPSGNMGTSTFTVTVEFNQPELACIGEINLTLNDECQALVIPQMLLVGNIACIDVFNWDIVVEDDDPSNGPIVDGCGSFTYSIRPASNGDEPTVGFTNEFSEENWDLLQTDAAGLENMIEFTDESLTFTTFGQNDFFFNDALASIQFGENGTVSFDFDYNGVDVPFDFAVIQTSFEGVAIVEEIIDEASNGSRSFEVNAGETLTFALLDDGEFPLAPNEDEASIFEITNFLFERPTSPFDLDFETCWGVVNAEDKTSPEADFVPADVTLLCVDFESDANNVSTLPNSVSRCYRVDAETGATIAGSMAPALRARLLAGRTSLEGPLVPTFTDGCAQELEVCVSDAVVFGEDADCDDIVLTRTFVATEISTCVSAGGEMNAPAVASYTITFDRPTLADLNTDGIQDVVEYEQCGTVNPTRADYPAPRAGDFPSLIVGDRVFNLRSGEAVCNIGVTYSDGEAIVTCPYTYKFIRTYTVIDWCDPSDVRTFTQVVKVGDTTAPVLTGPNVATNDAGDLVYGTNAGNICAAYLRLDDISVVDNCSGTNVSVSAEIFPGGDDTGAPIGAFTVVPGGSPELSSAIPAGRHLLRYTSTDECGNTSIDDFFFVVEDQTPPVAICEDGLNISIAGGANNGFAVLTPENIDNGSYDDCSGVSLSIARVNSSDLPIGTYGPQITLTCADLGTVRVGLRVEDALGNVNFCWLDVLVEDKLRPTCVAPANTTITCTEYNTTLPADIQDATDAQLDAIFGAAAGVDNCGTTITQSISGDVNSCGVGTFTRTFVSTDDAGFTNAGACTQRIDVIGIHDYRLTFPTDESGDCADIPEYDGVGAEELACDLITTTTDVDTLRTLDAGDECFKLRITYDVVNWCEYNSLGDPYLVTRDGSGVNNRQRQPRNIDEDVLYVNVIPNNTAGTGDDQAFMTLFTDRALNTNAPQRDQEFVGYAGSDSRGFFRYTQFIKIYDEVAPEITFTELDECFAGSGEGCRTTVVIEFTALDECSDAVVGLELDANYVEAAGFNPDNAAALGIGVSLDNDGAGNYTVTATNVPVGEHALRVRASDGCGNFDVQIIEFCVTADRTPTPICIQTLTVVLMDDGNGGGTAAIWASDFIASPIEDCFGNEVTKYSLFRSSEAGAAGFVPSFDPPATNGIDDIDCDDFESGTVSVRVYAFDDNGSTPDYCEVIIEVQDNMGWCDDGGSGNIAGLITDQDDVAVDNVSVTLTGGMEMTTTTDASGQYRFAGLPLNVDYTVQPELDAPVNLRNVKSSDLVSMIGQILGTTTFDSPYDFVAADVNGDMELNIFDVVNVSQVILGQVDLFDGGESWVFVEAGAVIDVANPYAATFPEVYNANDLAGTITADFVAVEMGNPFGLSSRTALNLTTDEAQLEAGQTHTIVLDGTELAAFQGTLELGAGLELIGAEYTGEGGMNLNRAGEGMIAVALRTPSPTPPHGGGATENASRFGVTLTVRATTAVTLSEELRLTDAITVREGVGANGVGNGLDLAFNGDLAPAFAQNVLHQNTPNPVRLETVIRFELAAAAPATLTLRDATGRLVSVQEIDAAAGMNIVELTNIKAAGVLTYTLTSGDFTASRKMVVVK